jgi:hypothetical protein
MPPIAAGQVQLPRSTCAFLSSSYDRRRTAARAGQRLGNDLRRRCCASILGDHLDHLDRALNGPDGNLIARIVAGDSEPSLFRHVVEYPRDDMATALGSPDRPVPQYQ